jgi:5-dehydro-2-deoxygluconokinase
MEQAIRELQGGGVEPDIWKIEGLDRREDCEKMVAAARRDGRDKVACIILGRGEDEAKVQEWLTTAAAVPGFIGFAVGRTDFWDPLVAWRNGKESREQAVEQISSHYRQFVHIFEQAHSKQAA